MPEAYREDQVTAPPVVLIAEDEEPIAQALAYLVEDYGCTALVALHGKRALELARAHAPALIITDLMMPQMTGGEVIATLRAEAASKGLEVPPIVVMTAAGKRYIASVAADAVLAKPFNLSEVEALLDRYLRLR